MKKGKFLAVALVVIVVVSALIAGCSSPAPSPTTTAAPTQAAPPTATAKPITLKAVTVFAQGNDSAWGWWYYKDMINKATNGRLIIEFAGGPEAIPAFEQPNAVVSGATDMCLTFGAYYKKLIPEANVLHLSQLNPAEERTSGFFDLFQQLHQAQGLYLVGRHQSATGYYIFMGKQKITRPQDLKGLRLRTAALYDALFKKLGIVPVTLDIADQYSALEKGLVDGTAITATSAASLALYEVAKYIEGPRFYDAGNGVTLINLNVWNKIPKDLQDIMVETEKKAEMEIWKHFSDIQTVSLKKMTDGGMQVVEWSPEDTKFFINTANDASWEENVATIKPDMIAKIKPMISKS